MQILSIIIPCYNEEETIHPFLTATKEVENELSNELVFEYLFVNDGSKDATLKILREFQGTLIMCIISPFHEILGKKAYIFSWFRTC